MKDPKRDVPAKNHWRFIDRGSELRPYCCSTASLVEIDENGLTKSHKWFMVGGQNDSGPTGTVEVMEFTDPNPRWRNVGTMLQPLATTKVVLLPDGNVLVGQGVNRTVRAPPATRSASTRRKDISSRSSTLATWTAGRA